MYSIAASRLNGKLRSNVLPWVDATGTVDWPIRSRQCLFWLRYVQPNRLISCRDGSDEEFDVTEGRIEGRMCVRKGDQHYGWQCVLSPYQICDGEIFCENGMQCYENSQLAAISGEIWPILNFGCTSTLPFPPVTKTALHSWNRTSASHKMRFYSTELESRVIENGKQRFGLQGSHGRGIFQ